jgi:hypothetical protein
MLILYVNILPARIGKIKNRDKIMNTNLKIIAHCKEITLQLQILDTIVNKHFKDKYIVSDFIME